MPSSSSSSSSYEEWSDEDVEAFLKRLLTAILLVGIGYYIFLPHRRHNQQRPPAQPQYPIQHARNPAVRPPAAASATAVPQNGMGRTAQPNQRDAQLQMHDQDEEGIESFLKPYLRLPPHHVPLKIATSFGSNTARTSYNGIVPFRCTKASEWEANILESSSGESSNVTLKNRKDRARILARLFAARKIDPPPGRGKMLILSICSSRILAQGSDKVKLQRVLFLLGTYYNTFVMLCCDDDEEYANHDNGQARDSNTPAAGSGQNYYLLEKQRCRAIISKLYEEGNDGILTEDVIPSHRIVVTKSVPSRVAFVRSFPTKPDYVIVDCKEKDSIVHGNTKATDKSKDEELQAQLNKFGYNVIRVRSLEALLSD